MAFTFFTKKTKIMLMIKMAKFLRSNREVVPIFKITASIKATAPTLIKFKKCFNTIDFRIFGINGFNNKTNKKDGKNIPVVAAIAPQNPFS